MEQPVQTGSKQSGIHALIAVRNRLRLVDQAAAHRRWWCGGRV